MKATSFYLSGDEDIRLSTEEKFYKLQDAFNDLVDKHNELLDAHTDLIKRVDYLERLNG